ncbi:hypothetical protein ACO0QE_003499 [Hanseniaspora vineae]
MISIFQNTIKIRCGSVPAPSHFIKPTVPHNFIRKNYFHQTHKLLDYEPSHIDTYLLRRKLVAQGGFTNEQSDVIIKMITQSLNDGVKHITNQLTKREDLIKLAYRQKVDFTKLKDELLLLARNEFNKIDAEQEKLRHDLERLSRRLREEITKCNAGFKLDISLEKGRIKEEGSLHDLQIKEIDSRIDKEVNNMKIQIDSVKTQVLQWMIGVSSGAFALVLAYIRLLS